MNLQLKILINNLKVFSNTMNIDDTINNFQLCPASEIL